MQDIMVVAEKSSIPKADVTMMTDKVRAAVARWSTFASQAGLSSQRRQEIDRLLNAHRRA